MSDNPLVQDYLNAPEPQEPGGNPLVAEYRATEAQPASFRAHGGPVEYNPRESLRNLWPSARNYVGNIAQAAVSPVDTADVIMKSGIGLMEAGEARVAEWAWENMPHVTQALVAVNNTLADLGLGVPRLDDTGQRENAPFRQYGEAVIDFLDARYGGWDNVKQTAMDDPVGLLADVGMAVTAGASLAPTVSAASAASKFGAAMDPVSAILLSAKSAGKSALVTKWGKNLPSRWYQKSAKFGGSRMTPDQADKLAQTALKYDIHPSPEGLQKVQTILDGIGQAIGGVIRDADTPDVMVRPVEIARRVADLRKSKRFGITAAQDRRTINKVVNGWLDEMDAAGKTHFSLKEVQQMKVELDKAIRWNQRAGPAARPTVEDTYVALRSGMYDAISTRTPDELRAMNAEFAALADLRDPLTAAANRIGRRDFTGIGAAADVVMGNAVAPGTAGTVAGLTMGVLDSPHPRATAARAIHNFAQRPLMQQPGPAYWSRGAAFQGGREGDYVPPETTEQTQ